MFKLKKIQFKINKELAKKKIYSKLQKAILIKTFFFYIFEKKKKSSMFKILAQINKLVLPSFTKKRLDLAKANKWQMAIIGYRYYVTTRALD
jgi:hypothetical protein